MPDRDQRFNDQQAPQPVSPPRQEGYVIERPSIVMPLEQTPNVAHAKNKLHLFSEFCEYPDSVSFHDQEPGEEVLLFLRKSQIANIHWIVTTILLLVLPLGLLLVPKSALPFLLPQGLLVVIWFFYYLVVVTYAFVNFVIWYYNAALITNKRIVDIDFHQLIYKDIAETKLGLVQDVSYRQQSVVESLFDFGHVLVQTAGTIDNFEFDSLPHPERVEEIVNSLVGKGRVYVP